MTSSSDIVASLEEVKNEMDDWVLVPTDAAAAYEEVAAVKKAAKEVLAAIEFVLDDLAEAFEQQGTKKFVADGKQLKVRREAKMKNWDWDGLLREVLDHTFVDHETGEILEFGPVERVKMLMSFRPSTAPLKGGLREMLDPDEKLKGKDWVDAQSQFCEVEWTAPKIQETRP